ncbi:MULTISPECIES: hypothetical protein [Pseudoalteromonas]|uniref:Uncharacterized protein n=1 Tax=Pseudoalteromonas obscura TaxID=3048491 RepID=A0ABT7ENE0_9GAMM|nr:MULTISPECIES: hypothetical protein [Pseudoalteromonas]MBQ4835176.1 hypothetical protein [Pseudoalteromonas luteoviolacea]MDK2596572.1 hypothetical protein [Pseudoalteromonas sp. P94(2023)]
MRLLIVLLALYSGLSFATPSHTGKITSILSGPVYGDKLFIKVEGSLIKKSSCHTNTNFDYVLDTSTASGERYMSMILTAYASGRSVTITGYDGCSIYTGVTNFRSISLK